MANNGARFNVLNLDVFAVFSLHAEGPNLASAVLQRHFRYFLLPHVFQSEGRSAYTSGTLVLTLQQVTAAWDILRPLDASGLHLMQRDWDRPGVQLSLQTWSQFAQSGSDAAFATAGNPVGHREL